MYFVSKIKQFLADQKAAGGVVGYYMTILIATIVVLSVVMPTVIDQIATITANVSATTNTILDLFALMLALGLLMLYMRPLM